MEPNEKISDAEMSYMLKTGRPDSKRAMPPGSTPETAVKARQPNPIFDAPFPATAPAQATKPGTVMIGGVRHLDIPNQPKPGPLGMMAGAYAQTAAHVVTGGAENRIAQQREASRTGLDTTQELADKAKKDAAAPSTSTQTNPLLQGLQGYDPSHLSSNQRSEYAAAYGNEIDKVTGTGPAAELVRMQGRDARQGIDFGVMEKRFDAYKKNDGLLATRNVREDMLGSGIQMSKDANGGLVISDSGNKTNPLLGAGGSSINMQEGNNIMARENAARGQMIDSMIQAQGGNGVGILGGINLAGNQQREAMAKQALQPIEGARGLTANQVRAASDLMKQNSDDTYRQQELAQKSQQAGIMAGIEQQKIAGNPLDSQLKQQQLAAGSRTMEQQKRIDALALSLQSEADPNKRAAITESILAAQGKGSTDRFAVANRNVYNESGQVVGQESQVFDKATGILAGIKPAAQSNGLQSFETKEALQAAKAAGKIKSGDVVNTPAGMIRIN
jgi:hypothetical protein